MNHLEQKVVLVLNRNWQAIHVKSPIEAFSMMASDAATALDIQGADSMVPVKWKDWIKLPVRESDQVVMTVRGPIRIPTVIVALKYAKVPKRRPRFSLKGIWERDGGRCQYTGKELRPGEGNIDHVLPRSRGGKTDWENCVLSHKEVNSKKANLLPEEAGLKLIKKPTKPKEVPVTDNLKNQHQITDWKPFIR